MAELDFERSKVTLWEREPWDLSWLYHAGQWKIEEAFRRIGGKLFIGDCARQFGKSVWAVTKCVEKAHSKRRAKIRYATAFLSDLEQFIIPAFEFVLADCPAHLAPRFVQQKSEFRFPNGSVIKLVGLDRKPNGLRGNKLDLVVLDEAGFMARLLYLYRSVLIPATTHVPDAKIIVISTQPESPDHDFCTLIDTTSDPTSPNYGSYVKLDIYQNPLLTPERIEQIAKDCGGKDSTDFRREYLCERILDEERAIVPDWKPEFLVERPATKYDSYYHRYIWMDVGVKVDKTVILFAFFDYRQQHVFVEDEIVIKSSRVTTKVIAKAIKEKLEERPEYKNAYRRIADNSHPLLLNDLAADEDVYFSATEKDRLHEMVVELKDWVRGGRFLVHPRCKFLGGSMSTGIWNKRRDDFERSKVYGHYDALAASVYGVKNIDQQTNPIPSHIDFNPVRQFQKEKKEKAQADELSNAFTPRRR